MNKKLRSSLIVGIGAISMAFGAGFVFNASAVPPDGECPGGPCVRGDGNGGPAMRGQGKRGKRGKRGMRGMRGHGMRGMGMMGPRMTKRLGLDESQQAELKKLHAVKLATVTPVKLQLVGKRAEMKALWSAETPHRRAILAKQNEIAKLRA